MSEEIKRIDGVPHKSVLIPCPDGIEGCLVAHYRWLPIGECENLFKEAEELSTRMKFLRSIVQNVAPSYPQREIDEWNRVSDDCIHDLKAWKEDVVAFLNSKTDVRGSDENEQ